MQQTGVHFVNEKGNKDVWGWRGGNQVPEAWNGEADRSQKQERKPGWQESLDSSASSPTGGKERKMGAGIPTGLNSAAWWWWASSCFTLPACPWEDLAVQTREEQGLLGSHPLGGGGGGDTMKACGRLRAVTSLRLHRILFWLSQLGEKPPANYIHRQFFFQFFIYLFIPCLVLGRKKKPQLRMAHGFHKIRQDSRILKADGRREENKDGCQVEPATGLLLAHASLSSGTRWPHGIPYVSWGCQGPPGIQVQTCKTYLWSEYAFDIETSKPLQVCIGDSRVVESLWGQSWDFPALRYVWFGDQGSLRRRVWRGIKPIFRRCLSLTRVKMAMIRKTANDQRWPGCGEMGAPAHCGGNGNWSNHWKTVWRLLIQVRVGLPWDSAIPLLGIQVFLALRWGHVPTNAPLSWEYCKSNMHVICLIPKS